MELSKTILIRVFLLSLAFYNSLAETCGEGCPNSSPCCCSGLPSECKDKCTDMDSGTVRQLSRPWAVKEEVCIYGLDNLKMGKHAGIATVGLELESDIYFLTSDSFDGSFNSVKDLKGKIAAQVEDVLVTLEIVPHPINQGRWNVVFEYITDPSQVFMPADLKIKMLSMIDVANQCNKKMSEGDLSWLKPEYRKLKPILNNVAVPFFQINFMCSKEGWKLLQKHLVKNSGGSEVTFDKFYKTKFHELGKYINQGTYKNNMAILPKCDINSVFGLSITHADSVEGNIKRQIDGTPYCLFEYRDGDSFIKPIMKGSVIDYQIKDCSL